MKWRNVRGYLFHLLFPFQVDFDATLLHQITSSCPFMLVDATHLHYFTVILISFHINLECYYAFNSFLQEQIHGCLATLLQTTLWLFFISNICFVVLYWNASVDDWENALNTYKLGKNNWLNKNQQKIFIFSLLYFNQYFLHFLKYLIGLFQMYF